MSSNGQIPSSELASIYGGRLRKDAAAAWNAMEAEAYRQTGKHLRPTGSQSSYRDYANQVYFWNLYISGRGNLAARPGTSNHGWGIAVDLAEPWMRTWIDQHGAKYGWKKTEAFNEWWHVNYVGGFHPQPKPNPLAPLGKKRRFAAERLQHHRREAIRQARSGKGPKWAKQVAWRAYWRAKLYAYYKRAEKGKQKSIMLRVLKDRDGQL